MPQQKAKRRRWWAVLAIVLLGLAALGLGGSQVVRSEWFLRQRLDPKLEALGRRLGGSFRYEHVSPIGWTGVAVQGLTFEPDGQTGLPIPVRVREIAVYPDLEALLWGEIVPRRIELSGVEVEFWLDDQAGGRGHWPWLEAAVKAWQAPDQHASAQSDGSQRDPAGAQFPDIIFHDGEVRLRSPAHSLPEASLYLVDVRVHKDGPQLLVDGNIGLEGVGYALLSADADLRRAEVGVALQLQDPTNDLMAALPGARDKIAPILGSNSKLSLKGAELSWPPALILHDIQLSDALLRIPGQDAAFIESIGAHRVEVAFLQDLVQVRVVELNAQAKLQWLNDALSPRLPLSLPELGVGIDFARRRVGMAFEVSSPAGYLRVASAYDISARDFAFDLQAHQFDAGALLSLMPYAGPITVTEGLLDGQLGVRYLIGDGLLRLQSDLGVSGVSLVAPWLSEAPMSNLRFRLKGDALLDLWEQTITVEKGQMVVGDLPMSVSGVVRRVGDGRDIHARLNIQAQNLEAASLLPSLPQGFAPALAGYALKGSFSLGLDLDLDTRQPELMQFNPQFEMSHAEVLAFGPDAPIPLLATNDFEIKVNTAHPPKVIGPKRPDWAPLNTLPKTLLMALTAAEDNQFYQHHGFDLKAIRSSLIANFEAGHIVRGGSTITQQLAKNLFLSQKKTIARKLQESFLTWQMEQHLSKRRILELYLNMVHWGPNIYGVHAAAQHYFKLPPSQLSLREAIFLCAILPNPVRFGEHYAQGFVQADRLQKMLNILSILNQRKLIAEDEYSLTRTRLSKAQISKQPRPLPTHQ